MDKQALILLSSINYILGVIDAREGQNSDVTLDCVRAALEVAVDEFCDGGQNGNN